MRVVLQRVREAAVEVEHETVGSIGQGYLLLLGVSKGDTEAQARWLAEKIVKLRLFDSEEGKINDRSLVDIGGAALVVSQFTLMGRTEKGNRPDYTQAESPEVAQNLYERFIGFLREAGVEHVDSGRFGAYMQVRSMNDGPVTLVLER